MFKRFRHIFAKHKEQQAEQAHWIRFEKFRVMIRLWGLTWAELIDALRFGPRLFVSAYGYLLWHTINWYMSIPTTATTPNMAQATLLSAVFGGASVIFAFYVNTGRKWGDNPNVSDGAYPSNLNLPIPSSMVAPPAPVAPPAIPFTSLTQPELPPEMTTDVNGQVVPIDDEHSLPPDKN